MGSHSPGYATAQHIQNAIVKGEAIPEPGVPESFNVLLKELQSLGLAVELLNEERVPLA